MVPILRKPEMDDGPSFSLPSGPRYSSIGKQCGSAGGVQAIRRRLDKLRGGERMTCLYRQVFYFGTVALLLQKEKIVFHTILK